MKFADDDGRRLKNGHMRKSSIQNEGVVNDLVSEHKGVSDSSLRTAVGTVKEGKDDLFVKIVKEINEHCKNQHVE